MHPGLQRQTSEAMEVKRKLGLEDFENAVANLLSRMKDEDGRPCARVDLAVSPELIFQLESLLQFLTFAVPYTEAIKEAVRRAGRKGKGPDR